MPSVVAIGNSALSNYLKIATLPEQDRSSVFQTFSNEQKAEFVRLQFALQLVKSADLDKQQVGFLLDAISKTLPDMYDKTDPAKIALSRKLGHELEVEAMSIFEPLVAARILGAVHAKKDDDVALLRTYLDLMNVGMLQRKKLVREMPMAQSASIWKTQLAFHLAASHLSIEQNSFIADLMPKVEKILETNLVLSPEDRARVGQELEQDILKYFTRPEAYAVFMAIGIQSVVRDTASQGLDSLGSCTCRWYCDDWNQSCNQGSCRSVNLCGPFDDWECTGKCG